MVEVSNNHAMYVVIASFLIYSMQLDTAPLSFGGQEHTTEPGPSLESRAVDSVGVK